MRFRSNPIVSALEHIEHTGGLGAFVATPTQRRAVATVLLKRGLIRWNGRSERYQLTRSGRRLQADHAPRPARRSVLGRLTGRLGVAACMLATIGLAIISGPSLSSRIVEERAAAMQPEPP